MDLVTLYRQCRSSRLIDTNRSDTVEHIYTLCNTVLIAMSLRDIQGAWEGKQVCLEGQKSGLEAFMALYTDISSFGRGGSRFACHTVDKQPE